MESRPTPIQIYAGVGCIDTTLEVASMLGKYLRVVYVEIKGWGIITRNMDILFITYVI